jgi:hypothetical protein
MGEGEDKTIHEHSVGSHVVRVGALEHGAARARAREHQSVGIGGSF